MPVHVEMHTKDLLIEEYKRLNEAFSKNEELGERRVQFLVSLVTGVFGGMVLLVTTDSGIAATRLDVVAAIAISASVFLLIVGLLTFDRLLRRDEVTEEYKRAIDDVRALFLQPYDAQEWFSRAARYSPFTTKTPTTRLGRLAQLVMMLNAFIAAALCVLVWMLVRGWPTNVSQVLIMIASIAAVLAGTATLQQRWWRHNYGR